MGKSSPVNPFMPGPGAGTGCPGLAEPGSAAHRITESQNHRITTPRGSRQRLLRSPSPFTLVRGLWQATLRFRFLLSCSLGMFSLASRVLRHESLGYKYTAPCLRGLCGVFLPVLFIPLGRPGAGRSAWSWLR